MWRCIMKGIIKTVLLLAIPAMIENILQVFVGSVDTYFIGKLGTEALVGVGVTNVIMNVYIAFFFAIGVGATALIARHYGAGEKKDAKKVLQHAIILSGGLGIVLGLINLFISKGLLAFMNLDAETISLTLPYFLVVSVPAVFLSIMMVLSSALRGVGDTKTPMKVGMVINIINIILDYVLIFGIGSFEGFGFVGAAIATTFARFVGMLLLYRKLSNGKGDISLNIKELIQTKFEKKIFKLLGKISFPAATEKLIMRGGQILYSGIIVKISADTYAAHNIAGSIEAYSYLPAMGFSVAAATLVGQSLGKKDPDTAKTYGWVSYGISTLFMIVIAAIFAGFAPFFVGLFTDDPVVAGFAVSALRIVALVQPFLASTMVITSALQGAGDTKFPMFSTLIGIWTVRVVGIYVLGLVMGLGIIGVWISVSLDITIRGIILMLRFKRGKWTNIKLSMN